MLELKTEHANAEIEETLRNVGSYTADLRKVRQGAPYDEAEGSINLSADMALLEQVKAVAVQKVTSVLKYSVVVGIGGSNLGTRAVYDAILGCGDLESGRFPRMLFAETTDPEWLIRLTGLLGTLSEPEELLLTLISKSGSTTETIANFEIIMQALHKKFDDVTERVVVVTDKGSNLWQAAEAKNMTHLPIPALVGGRYSVLSAVGLFPLLSVGVDIESLRRGANELLDRCLDNDDNIAAQSAAILMVQQERGHRINDTFLFHPELEALGKWYRQLMGESVGKEKSLTGEVVHAGITPTVSLGSTDLHSVGQLYLGGPKDKLTTFVYSKQSEEISVPEDRLFPSLVPMITGKSASGIMTAILEGVKVAYQKADLPYVEVILDSIDAYSLGAFLQFKMLEMMYLGKLLNVNSFDQPSVEAYKLETRRLLEDQ